MMYNIYIFLIGMEGISIKGMKKDARKGVQQANTYNPDSTCSHGCSFLLLYSY